jgi:hypothetical protein
MISFANGFTGITVVPDNNRYSPGPLDGNMPTVPTAEAVPVLRVTYRKKVRVMAGSYLTASALLFAGSGCQIVSAGPQLAVLGAGLAGIVLRARDE